MPLAEKAQLDKKSSSPSMDDPSAVMVDSDATEYSSSFGDTASGCENTSGTSDCEVDSEFGVKNAVASVCNTSDSVLPTKRKEVTKHWKNFIRPLMWRCKWTELKMKEMDEKIKKYSRMLEEIDQAKLKSCFKRKSMKRRKRRQVEKMNDLTLLTSDHPIFSYIGCNAENKKSDLDGTSTTNDIAATDPVTKQASFAVSDECYSVEDSFLEQSLSMIESTRSCIRKLKNNLDGVTQKNCTKLPSSENMSLVSSLDAQTSSTYSPAISTVPEILDIKEFAASLLSVAANVKINIEEPLIEHGLGHTYQWITEESLQFGM